MSASNVVSFGPPIHQLGGRRGSGEQGHAPIRPAQGSSDQNSQGNDGCNSQRPNKRRPSNEGYSTDQDESNDGDGIGGGHGGKRLRTGDDDQRLSCPFRKRNPVKFNVRDHQNCAVQSFPDLSQLK